MAKKKRRSGHKGGQRTASRPSAAPAAGAGPVASPDGEASKRQARKEEARRQREELRKRMVRRRRARQGGMAAGIIAVIAVVVFFVASGGGSSNPGGPLPGLLKTKAPWTANNAQADARLSAIGLPPLSPSEGTALHIHQHLDIYVHGTKEIVPAEIGISNGQFAPLHTHDTSGVIHVESPTNRTYTLGQFFNVWGVRLTPMCLGGYCNSGGNTLTAYVNGKQVTGNPASIPLNFHDEIVLAYGTKSELPNPIPLTYTFPVGE